jgi:hypothetical protein
MQPLDGDKIMPYYLYKISTLEGIDLVKNLELLEVHDSFRPAKKQASTRHARKGFTNITTV